MYKQLLFPLLLSASFLHAETNTTQPDTQPPKKEVNETKEKNSTKSAKALLEEKVREQMEREKKYAKEQKFYQGDAYDLKAHEVDPNSLPDVPVIEPDYDFDITDVYRDDI